MAQINNSAERLYNILNQARSKANVPAKNVWADIFGIDGSDTAQLHVQVAELIKLAEDAKMDVEKLEGVNKDIYLRPFENIERVVSNTNLDVNWDNIKKQLNNETMLALQFCADSLTLAGIGENRIKEDDLANLQNEVESLLETIVADDDMPYELKVLIVERLEEIRNAILAYRVFGAEALRQALEYSLGKLFLYPGEVPENDNMNRFMAIISKLSTIVTFVLKTKELIGPQIAGLLESPNG